jgi:DNA-binding transcriptional LysR family regulator
MAINSENNLAIGAALDGSGIARVPATYMEPHIASRRLVEPLEDWTPRSAGVLCQLSEPAADAGIYRGAEGADEERVTCHIPE